MFDALRRLDVSSRRVPTLRGVPIVGFQASGGDGEPYGGAPVFGGGREFHRIWTVDR